MKIVQQVWIDALLPLLGFDAIQAKHYYYWIEVRHVVEKSWMQSKNFNNKTKYLHILQEDIFNMLENI